MEARGGEDRSGAIHKLSGAVSGAPHPRRGVQAEVAIQQAFLELADTLLSSSTTEFYQRLAQTQAAFAHAGEMEEHRPDAELFACLVEMLLAFRNLAHDRVSTARRLKELFHYLRTVLAPQWWPTYRSEVANVCVARILEIAEMIEVERQQVKVTLTQKSFLRHSATEH